MWDGLEWSKGEGERPVESLLQQSRLGLRSVRMNVRRNRKDGKKASREITFPRRPGRECYLSSFQES